MTTPHGEPPDQAWVRGGGEWRYGQDLTEASSKSIMKGSTVSPGGSYSNVQANVNNEIKTPVVQQAAVVVTTGLIAGQTVTRYDYTSNGTWTKPTPAAGKRISRIGAAAISGGNGGNGPPGGYGDGAEGGEGGGYTYAEFAPDDVPGSVAVTIGAGGAGGGEGAVGAAGGVSSFGTLVIGKPGTSYVQTSQGALSATSAPGYGGRGGGGATGESLSYQSPGTRGQSTALGVGGNGGAARTSGSPGGTTGTDPQILSGGAGGGGGGGASGAGLNSIRPGGGGAGAAPGGGGGGGGGGTAGSFTSYLPGGTGANGGVSVWVYFEDITTT